MYKRAAMGGATLGVRQMTVVGLLSAICMVLGLTGYGFVPLPLVKATVMHIPVIIGAILEGPVVGMMIGFLFGLFSIFQNLTTPNILSFAFINPLVSVLPRVFIGLVAYYCYKLLPIRQEAIKIGFGAAMASIMHTIGVLGMLYILYAAQYAEAKGISLAMTAKVISGVAMMNGLPEAIISVIVTVPVIMMLRRVRK